VSLTKLTEGDLEAAIRRLQRLQAKAPDRPAGVECLVCSDTLVIIEDYPCVDKDTGEPIGDETYACAVPCSACKAGQLRYKRDALERCFMANPQQAKPADIDDLPKDEGQSDFDF